MECNALIARGVSDLIVKTRELVVTIITSAKQEVGPCCQAFTQIGLSIVVELSTTPAACFLLLCSLDLTDPSQVPFIQKKYRHAIGAMAKTRSQAEYHLQVTRAFGDLEKRL